MNGHWNVSKGACVDLCHGDSDHVLPSAKRRLLRCCLTVASKKTTPLPTLRPFWRLVRQYILLTRNEFRQSEISLQLDMDQKCLWLEQGLLGLAAGSKCTSRLGGSRPVFLFIAAWLPNLQLLVMTEKYLQSMKDCMYVCQQWLCHTREVWCRTRNYTRFLLKFSDCFLAAFSRKHFRSWRFSRCTAAVSAKGTEAARMQSALFMVIVTAQKKFSCGVTNRRQSHACSKYFYATGHRASSVIVPHFQCLKTDWNWWHWVYRCTCS